MFYFFILSSAITNEAVDETSKTDIKTCISSTLFRPFFMLTHIATLVILENLKPLKSLEKHFSQPGRYQRIVYLIKDCIKCQTIKSKRHDLHKEPLKQWRTLNLQLLNQST